MDARQPRRTPEARVGGGRSADVVVIGGGIIGCAAAAMLATRGARVILVEANEIGAGASGRNLGAIQHPFDPLLADLHRESLERYRALADGTGHAFAIGSRPAGLLLVTRDAEGAARQARRMAAAVPELEPEMVPPAELRSLEPSLASGLAGVRLATGYPVPPHAATHAWAALAEARGAVISLGRPARPVIEHGEAVGVRLGDGGRIAADRVLVAAGPWSPPLVDPTGTWKPIVATWGVTLQLRLGGAAPRHIVEEDEVDAVNRAAAATRRAAASDDDEPPSLFSIASAGGVSTLGSTFLPAEPDPARIEPLLLRRAAAFLPAVAEAKVVGRRLCARPQSVDGRPFIGAVPGAAALYLCAGHGPWGISTGPASAAMVVRSILDGTPPPAELDAGRTPAG